MIIYIFNNHFPDNGGFSKRCMKEIEILSKENKILVLCRGRNRRVDRRFVYTKFKKVKTHYFYPLFNANKSIANYKNYKSGYYEIIRNLGLSLDLAKQLSKILWKYRKEKNLKLYTIVSPLTVPLISYVIGKIFNAKSDIVEFHDLEPELAIHIKNLNHDSIILKIEYLLEKFMCNAYRKVVVTNKTQAEILIKRTKIGSDKLYIIPNTPFEINKKAKKIKNTYGLEKKDLILGYVSSLSYTYTISGSLKLIKSMPQLVKILPNIKLLIIGDGNGRILLEKLVDKYNLQTKVIFTGNIANVDELIQTFDIAIIPWKRELLSETILPTKLFEYMANKKAIIAPNFGEFKNVIDDGKNGILYNSNNDLLKKIALLSINKKRLSLLGLNAYKLYKTSFNNGDYSKELGKIVN